MPSMSNERVQQAVSEALEEAKVRVGSDRLLPFTAAELRFIQDVVAGALDKVLLQPKE